MRRLAISIAAMAFFVLAGVGWASDVPVFVCAQRALAGAAGLYLLIRLGGSLAIRILVSAAVAEQGGQRAPRNSRS